MRIDRRINVKTVDYDGGRAYELHPLSFMGRFHFDDFNICTNPFGLNTFLKPAKSLIM